MFEIDTEKKNTEELTKIAERIRPLVFNAADGIFRSYTVELLMNSIDYLVAAVWGSKKKGKLNKTQQEINQKTVAVITEIAQQLEFRELSTAQAFAIAYLIRELIISKVIYMAELARKQCLIEYGSEDMIHNIPNHVEPIGTA